MWRRDWKCIKISFLGPYRSHGISRQVWAIDLLRQGESWEPQFLCYWNRKSTAIPIPVPIGIFSMAPLQPTSHGTMYWYCNTLLLNIHINMTLNIDIWTCCMHAIALVWYQSTHYWIWSSQYQSICKVVVLSQQYSLPC